MMLPKMFMGILQRQADKMAFLPETKYEADSVKYIDLLNKHRRLNKRFTNTTLSTLESSSTQTAIAFVSKTALASGLVFARVLNTSALT